MFIEGQPKRVRQFKRSHPHLQLETLQIINRWESTANRDETYTGTYNYLHMSQGIHTKLGLAVYSQNIMGTDNGVKKRSSLFGLATAKRVYNWTTGWNLIITSITVTDLAAPCQGDRPWSPILSPRTFPRSSLEEHSPLFPPSWTRFQIFRHHFPAHDAPNVVCSEAPLCTLLQEHGADLKNSSALRRQLPPMELEEGNVFGSI